MTDEEALALVKAELTKVAGGMMDALSILAVLVYTSGNLSKDELLGFARKAADHLIARGASPYGPQILQGMIARLESFDGLVPMPRERKQ